jgi:hypothetical protein
MEPTERGDLPGNREFTFGGPKVQFVLGMVG